MKDNQAKCDKCYNYGNYLEIRPSKLDYSVKCSHCGKVKTLRMCDYEFISNNLKLFNFIRERKGE